MPIIVDIDRLSMESLHVLDQASALKKRDYFSVFCHIESLSEAEKRFFLRGLKEENEKLFKAYEKDQNKLFKKQQEEIEKHREEDRKKEGEKEKAFQKKWNNDYFFSQVKEINPNFCGVFLLEKRYYKVVDFEEAVLAAYEALSENSHPSVGIPLFFQRFLKRIRPKSCESLRSVSGCTILFCWDKETREDKLKAYKKKKQKEDQKYVDWGYSVI